MKSKKFFPKYGGRGGRAGASAGGTSAIPVNQSAMYLVIVESPSKCKKIEEYLGSQYQCIASKGHIRTIDGIKAIDTKATYDITFSIIEEKAGHVEEMRKIIRQFPPSAIYLATDDDREGEAISWHICQVFDLPVSTTKRILFHEITKPAILASIKTPTCINMSLVYAQHARQVLDVLVGYKISPTLWKHVHNNKKNGLSAGRCQTPALKLVYENEKENKKEYDKKWKTSAYFFSTNTKFDLTHDFVDNRTLEDFLEKSKTHTYKLTVGVPRETRRQPPVPFNTSKLLQMASNLLHYSPKMTMDLCQQLYQGGFITYMRTDSTKYSPVFIGSATAYIVGTYGAPYLGVELDKITNNDNANPHEAIRCTNLATMAVDGDKALQSMYRLIWKNTMESCMAHAVCNITKAKISAPSIVCDGGGGGNGGGTPPKKEIVAWYEHEVEVVAFAGWKRVGMTGATETEEKTRANTLIMYLQSIANKGEPFTYIYVDSTVSVQHRHSHYTEASLIQKLEELGIGRPSTFATIVDTIQERGYVKKKDIEGVKLECEEYKLRGNAIEKIERIKEFGAEKNKLQIQPTGIVCLEFLVEHFDALFSYGYTKSMEEDLDVVAQSTETVAGVDWKKICDTCLKEIKQLMKPLSKLEKTTYKLNDGYELVFHQYGASLKRVDENGDVEYKSVKKSVDIDLEKLKGGEYLAEDLMEIKNDVLGVYEGETVKIKTGKYGKYVEWGDKKISLKMLNKAVDAIELADVIPYIHQKKAEEQMVNVFGETVDMGVDLSAIKDTYQKTVYQGTTAGGGEGDGGVGGDAHAHGIVRIFNSNVSVRNGKYGNYVFYKTANMKKPVFYGLKGYHGNVKTCDYGEIKDFVKTKHKANLP